MPPVVIENPILNSPYSEPARHFRFTDESITSAIDEGRRISQYFVPIPQPRKKGQQMAFTEWKQYRVEENQFINHVRERVNFWRNSRYPGLTKTTARVLEYWQRTAVPHRLQDCDRLRQDSGNGDAHCLAHAQQAGRPIHFARAIR